MQKTYTEPYIVLILLTALLLPLLCRAQQNPMFTQYMFNSLTFNPAYAGSKEYLSANILYRTQWAGWNNPGNGLNPELETGGAPVTQTFTVHTPVGTRLGAGLSVVNDKIGATESTGANLSYAYRIAFAEGELALAVQGGITNFRGDFAGLIARDPLFSDAAFTEQMPNVWRPNFGAGLYYHSKTFYLGMSVPRLLESSLRDAAPAEQRNDNPARTYQHFYFTTGGAIPLKGNPDFVFRPSVLVKSVGLFGELKRQGNSTTIIGAPTEFDADISLFLYKTLWLGLSFRSSFEIFITGQSSYDSMDAWLAFYLKNGLRIGAAYDFSLTPVQKYSIGSLELSVGYDFNYSEIEQVNSPRYF